MVWTLKLSMDAKYNSLITKHPLFSNIAIDELEKLSSLFVIKSFSAGEEIVKEGDIIDAIYFIGQGQAEVRKSGQPLAVLGEGESIGLSGTGFFSTTGERTATVVALSDAIALCLDLEIFKNFLIDYPKVNQTFLESTNILSRMRFIKQVAPFAALSIEKLRLYAERIKESVVPKGTVLFRQGEMGEECYLIETGRVNIVIQDSHGNTKILAELHKTQLFGEAALLLNTPRNATAIVEEETRLLVISKDLLLEMMQKESNTARIITFLNQKRSRPIQVEGIEVFRQTADDGEEIITLKQNKENNYFRLSSPHGWFIWQLLDGTRSLKEILRSFYKEFNILNADLIFGFIFDLYDTGFVHLEMKRTEISASSLPLWIRILTIVRNVMEAKYGFKNVDNFITKTYDGFIWIFYTKIAQIILILLSLIGLSAFIFHSGQFIHLLNTSPDRWPLFLGATYTLFFTIIFHELAHAYTTKAFGRQVAAFGVGWLWIGPYAFCDTSDMWLCPDKLSRIAVDAAGLYLDFILGSLAALCLLIFPPSNITIFIWLFAMFNYTGVFTNLSPLLELDGYYALMDILNKPNLRESSVLMLVKVFSKKNQVSFWTTLKEHKEETIYWVACFLYIIAAGILPYFLIHHVFYGLLGSRNPLIGFSVSLFVTALSGLSIWAEFRRTQISRSA
jgi:putative peptide zinc metalloprotease protein